MASVADPLPAPTDTPSAEAASSAAVGVASSPSTLAKKVLLSVKGLRSRPVSGNSTCLSLFWCTTSFWTERHCWVNRFTCRHTTGGTVARASLLEWGCLSWQASQVNPSSFAPPPTVCGAMSRRRHPSTVGGPRSADTAPASARAWRARRASDDVDLSLLSRCFRSSDRYVQAATLNRTAPHPAHRSCVRIHPPNTRRTSVAGSGTTSGSSSSESEPETESSSARAESSGAGSSVAPLVTVPLCAPAPTPTPWAESWAVVGARSRCAGSPAKAVLDAD